MDLEVIGRRLRELRGVYRTQAEVAEAIGVTPAAISQYENGERAPGDQTKIALAKYYGVPVGELFFGE